MPIAKRTTPTKPPPKALGITCGIGSMLVGARQAGFRVLGNIEWRRYYHYKDGKGQNTFLSNFPGAIFPDFIDDLSDDQVGELEGVDLVLGHPECGNFSQLGGVNKKRLEKLKDPCDIPLFVNLVARLRPRFFVMDDLPKSFGAFPLEEYVRRLPDYDLYPEWVSNWGYGNSQEYRRRMFMIGSLKSEKWVFRPGETREDGRTLSRDLQDLVGKEGSVPNHEPADWDGTAQKNLSMRFIGDRPTWAEVGEYAKENWPPGQSMTYFANDGTIKKKPGCKVERWEGSSSVQDGGSYKIHPLEFRPLTVRERARIQGFPDDFIFYGTKLNPDGTYNPDRNVVMSKQTGKAMPIQFCRYVSNQIAAKIQGVPFTSSGERVLTPNPEVNQAKQQYCETVGYSDQEGACNECWMTSKCSIRTGKYGMKPLGVSRREPVILTRRVSLETVATPKPVQVQKPILEVPVTVTTYDNPKLKNLTQVGTVSIRKGETPGDYHCQCKFCSKVLGNLIGEDGTYYSRLERRKYYDPKESGKTGHAAKTPLHLARWAVQTYTKGGDWVLDPTAGAGTTIVESLVQGRNACGMELQYHDIIGSNVRKHAVGGRKAILGFGDARGIGKFLEVNRIPRPTLLVNNPPYSGDEHQTTLGLTDKDRKKGNWSTQFKYDHDLPNLAFLKEGDEYWETMRGIYQDSVRHLLPGGHVVIGVKDMMRAKKPYMLHLYLCQLLEMIPGLSFVGTAFLKHYPTTLFLNTYEKMYGVRPPLYQTISVFRKGLK